MKKIEHIGIAVKSIAETGKLYESLLGVPAYKEEEVLSEAVRTLFFSAGNTKIELLEATSAGSVIAGFIEKRGEGLHHIAFEVEDIAEAMERMRSQGFRLLNDTPKAGADNKLVCFVHPKDAAGVLIELCQSINPGNL